VAWSKTGRIQLNEEVTVTVTYQTNIGLFGGFGSFPITLRADAAGKVGSLLEVGDEMEKIKRIFKDKNGSGFPLIIAITPVALDCLYRHFGIFPAYDCGTGCAGCITGCRHLHRQRQL
jgi:hypothetical protein